MATMSGYHAVVDALRKENVLHFLRHFLSFLPVAISFVLLHLLHQKKMKEMATAVQYNAPVTWIVLNNLSLGWIKYVQKLTDERFIAADFCAQPDFVKTAEANKCFGVHVEQPKAIESALQEALRANADGVPAVVDVVVDAFDAPDGFREFHRDIWRIPA